MTDPLAGQWVAAGCTLVAPGGDAALLVVAPPQATGLVADLLLAAWSLLADRPAPVTIAAGGIRALPLDTPLLVASADAARLAGAGLLREAPWSAQPGSTAIAVEPARAHDPCPLSGIVYAGPAGAGPAHALVGRRRFERAATVLIGGVLAPALDPGQVLATHTRLGSLPAFSVGAEGTVDDVLAWWAGP